jgi:hypothetical protein
MEWKNYQSVECWVANWVATKDEMMEKKLVVYLAAK